MKTELVKAYYLLSQTLNFRETADNLFISQPTLTRQIESLEKEWGISLFRRNTRKVELTQEGQLLLEDARRLLEAEQNLFCHAALLNARKEQNLTVAYHGFPNLVIIGALLDEWYKLSPQTHVRVMTDPVEVLLERFRNKELDCLMLLKPCTNSLANVERIVVEKQYASFMLRRDYPVGPDEELDIRILHGQNIVMHPQSKSREVYDALLALCRKAGVIPARIIEAEEEMSVYVSNGQGIGLLPAYITDDKRDTLYTKLVRIKDSEGIFDRVLAYSADNENPSLASFLSMVRQLGRESRIPTNYFIK